MAFRLPSKMANVVNNVAKTCLPHILFVGVALQISLVFGAAIDLHPRDLPLFLMMNLPLVVLTILLIADDL